MRRWMFALLWLLWAVPAYGVIPSTAGWHQLANTTIDSVCACGVPQGSGPFPGVCAVEGCKAIESWSGAIFDSTRNRMVVFGGGHNAYYGNELYAFNLSAEPQTMTRLNNPGAPPSDVSNSTGPCTPSDPTGTQPSSRHTYDGQEYMANIDRMFVFGGAPACVFGYLSSDTWTFSFATMAWQKMNPSGTIPRADPGITTAYDSSTGLIWLHDRFDLYSYNFSTNTWTRRSNNNTTIGIHMGATIDPVHRRYVIVGPDSEQGFAARVYAYNIDAVGNIPRQTLNTTNGSTFLAGTYPGIDWHPPSETLVGWNGGDIVWSLDLDTNNWTGTSFSGGPGTASPNQGRGTHGRWRYSSASGVFALVNGTNNNAWAFRPSPAGPPDTTPPTAPTNLTGTPVSTSQIDLAWTASTDNVAVLGYRIERCQNAGCSNFSEIDATSAITYQSIGLTATTTYRYRVRAVDTSTNFSGYSNIVEATTQAAGGSDFTTRCAAAGVVRCFGFDTPSEFPICGGGTGGCFGQNFGIIPPSGTTDFTKAIRDTTVSASGASSLRMTVNSQTGADAAGAWFANFSSNLLTQFGASETFYVQWRQRFNPAMATTIFQNFQGNPQGGVKQVILVAGDKPGGILFTSCEANHIVVETFFQSIPRFATVYQSCTGCPSHVAYEHMYQYTGTDFWLQNAMPDPRCKYSNRGADGCSYWFADEWMTFKIRVDVGTRAGGTAVEFSNVRTRMWIARQGQPSQLVVDFTDSTPSNPPNQKLCAGPVSENQEWGKIWLLPYMTEKNPSQVHSQAITWYDELIISTQDIADPGGSGTDTTPPAPPGGVVVR